MAQVAMAAGVSRQTLYNVFGSREGLLQAVVVREANAIVDRMARVLEHEGLDPARAVGRAALLVLEGDRDSAPLRAIVTGDRELLPVLTTRSAPVLDVLGERTARMLAAGRPGVGAALAEEVADVAVRLTGSYTLRPIAPEEAARRVERVVQGMLSAGE
ncbi:TetR family transcriptional regulator [Nocardiopsis sp. CNT312]|uniref:TetR family transcriptional regulator n=1 Tax=Nocardiopsis sp. CNT312 TaxID=1137268 RepID=UPI0004B8AC69